MKKYISLIMISIFIVLTVGYYYVITNNISKKYPEFTFEKISGNEEAIKDLVITGEFHYNFFGYDSFRIDLEETKYFRDEPFVKKINRRYYKSIDIERLQKDYRNFMRTKDEYYGSYKETDDLLIYASLTLEPWEIDTEQFDIAILDKNTKETTAFQIPIPNRNHYLFFDIKEIFVKDDKLFLITVNDIPTNEMDVELKEVHFYTFDLKEQKLIDDEIIEQFEYETIGHGNHHIGVLLDETKEDVLVFKTEVIYTEEPHSINDTFTVDHLVKVDLKTNEIEEIKNEIDTGLPIALLDGKLIFTNIKENKLNLIAYDVEKKSTVHQLDVTKISTDFSLEELYEPVIWDGKFYFIPEIVNNQFETTVSVVDLLNFEKEYEGKINIEERAELRGISYYFDQVEIRKFE